jgi:hypothetical protein
LPGNIKITACAEVPSEKYVIGEGKGKGPPITYCEVMGGGGGREVQLYLYSILIFVEKIYKMQHLDGSGTPVPYIGRTVLKG